MITTGPIMTASAAIATSIIAAFSGMNMIETFSISKNFEMQKCSSSSSNNIDRFRTKTTDEIVSELENMKRKDLFELFLSCDAPSDVDSVSGEWNTKLLDNRSWFMTSVSNIMTNRLLGSNKKWYGKTINSNTPGINKFHPFGLSSDTEIQKSITKEQPFDCTIGPSKFLPEQKSLTLKYRNYQIPISLWRTLVDEARVVRLDNGAKVLIGMGFMTWSGGPLNSTPFCMYKNN
uniref:Uncharacterized protein n=1 Tax=Ditylum brightwellii TaxID=49249 RepID=A0A7S2EPG1_9STRA|mmetsp:Transcript_38537/g.57784  ORF Transcript_38537/g.57784 Transcript_38537/m.57784 type:complete len:233 (+) Transcript_38537:48-746(+)